MIVTVGDNGWTPEGFQKNLCDIGSWAYSLFHWKRQQKIHIRTRLYTSITMTFKQNIVQIFMTRVFLRFHRPC